MGLAMSRAMYLQSSEITITDCFFEGNTADYGGAIVVYDYTNITLVGNTFLGNQASISGGAIFSGENSTIALKPAPRNRFKYNSAAYSGGALNCYRCTLKMISDSIVPCTLSEDFNQNTAVYGGALFLYDSMVSMYGTVVAFSGNFATVNGGAIYSLNTTLAFVNRHLCISGNVAGESGGGMFLSGGLTTFGQNERFICRFSDNFGGLSGGAIFSELGSLELLGRGRFTGNYVSRGGGGAILTFYNDLLRIKGEFYFSSNCALTGGAISLIGFSTVLLDGKYIEFVNNSVIKGGGGISSFYSRLISGADQLNFTNNAALGQGGAIWSSQCNQYQFKSAIFVNNTAQCGSALSIAKQNSMLLDITFIDNSGSALCAIETNITFSGNTRMIGNVGNLGGGGYIERSVVSFTGQTLFTENQGVVGGVMSVVHGSTVSFSGVTVFTNNSAIGEGGAFQLSDSQITLRGNVYFLSNSAQRGGAMYFQGVSSLILPTGSVLTTASNYASTYGGAIYHDDAITPLQCDFGNQEDSEVDLIPFLPQCFINMEVSNQTLIFSYDDNAGEDGSFLYGGLLDKCQISAADSPFQLSWIPLAEIITNMVHIESTENTTNAVSSEPYRVCLCENSSFADGVNCSPVGEVSVYRGETFSVYLLALAQAGSLAYTSVTAKVSSTARLKLDQSVQTLPPACADLTYNLYSTSSYEELVLYPDGPCRDTGQARAVINVTLLPCPDAFIQSGEECVCEERLRVYDAECVIDDSIYVHRKSASKFWMSALYVNKFYQGLILYKTCPFEYCINESVHVTLDDPDVQCNVNRIGILCGACAANYSLMLGSSRCQVCSNTYLVLLLPFAAAGIVLVAFLTFLKLTVATGMINSVILYAHIVQINRNLFFPDNTRNVLTVFIAWLNLDLGLETCFFHRMDAYVQTWLQFVFPVYIWSLVGFIIITSRHFVTMSKLIGSNPIAVLATLLLMSYTKILKIIIEVYSSVDLEYPHNKTVTVWLKDANVPYLRSKHLILTVVTTVVLVFLFLPYTLLLLVGHKLYRFSGRKYFRWFRRIKPLLDSYHAPYKTHTRYWTGFLLLVRCVLYVVFSSNSLGATTKSLLAIIITFTLVNITAWLLLKNVYKKNYVNILEASVYLNLIILSAATLARANSQALVHTLVGIVFVTMTGIILYHFHLLYIARSAVWLQLRAKVRETALSRCRGHQPLPSMNVAATVSSHDQEKFVTETFIDMRETLLED